MWKIVKEKKNQKKTHRWKNLDNYLIINSSI